MATEKFTVRLPTDIRDRVEAYANDRDIDASKALCRAADHGLQEFGYGDANPTTLQTVMDRIGWSMLFVAFLAMGVTVITTADFADFAVLFLGFGALALAIYRLEPNVTERVVTWLE